MSNMRKLLFSLGTKKYAEWILVVAVFFLTSALYMGTSFLNFNTTVLGKSGDHTAGIIFVNFTHPDRPWPGFTALTNYPYGENLRIPISATTQGQLLGHWIFAKATNLVAGWNLMVLLGYMGTALIMYFFIRHFTADKRVAFFGAYATTFNPYHAFSTTGQIAGMFSGIFIVALWRFIILWEKPNRTNALILAAIIGASFYIDGYFILLSIVLLGALWLAIISYYLLIARIPIQKIKAQLRYFALSNVIVVACLLPLVWVNVHYAQQIGEILGNARSNIAIEAQTYSAHLSYYFSPGNVLYLGLSIVGLALFYVVHMRKVIHTSTRASLSKHQPLIFISWAVLTVGLVSAWVSLQPMFKLGHITLYNPSYLIVSLTSVWRVFGRLYILVDIAFVTLACLGLQQLLKKYRSREVVIVTLCMGLMLLELTIPSLRYRKPSFNYSNAPPIYHWLHDDKASNSIRAVAEYPLEGYGHEADYFTFIQVSRKPIINANLHNSPQLKLKQSIIGINDPQTIPVLRALGVDLVNVRDISHQISGEFLTIRNAARTNKELQLFMTYEQPGKGIDTYKILPGHVSSYALTAEPTTLLRSKLTPTGNAEYVFSKNIVLGLEELPNAVKRESVSVSFDISNDTKLKATVLQNGALLWTGAIGPTRQTIRFDARTNGPITMYVQTAPKQTASVLTNLQVLNR